MPRIPYQVTPDVSPASAPPSDYNSAQASPAAFGGITGSAVQKLGMDAQQASNAAVSTAILIQERHNHVAHDDAFNQLQVGGETILHGDPNDPSKPGLLKLVGADALHAIPDATNQLETLRQQIRAGLQNDAQRLEFDQTSRRYIGQVRDRIGEFGDAQFKSYGMVTAKSGQQIQLQKIAQDPAPAFGYSVAIEATSDAF